MPKHPVEEIAETVDGTIEEVGSLPDGSGFATMSMPLPEDHWLYADHEDFEAPPMLLRLGQEDPRHEQFVKAIWAAAKYALRVSTQNGKTDYDPDAVCQNMVVGLIGYHTADGLSHEEWADPKPAPDRLA